MHYTIIVTVFTKEDPLGSASILIKVKGDKDANLVFDSSKIPGEIIDCLVVKTGTPDTLKRALVGAWYETMNAIKPGSPKVEPAYKYMADYSGCSVKEFKEQLKTTSMFYNAKDAADFAEGKTKGLDLKKTMEFVRTFSFDHGLYGEGAPNKDFIGIMFPDASVIGDPKKVKLRFDAVYMRMAANGTLGEVPLATGGN